MPKKESSPGTSITILLVALLFAYFMHYYAVHGWVYVQYRFSPETVSIIKLISSIVLAVCILVVFAVSVYWKKNTTATFRQWLARTLFFVSFYILALVFVNNDALLHWGVHILLGALLLPSAPIIGFMTQRSLEELGWSDWRITLSVVGFQLLLLYGVIGRIYFHFSR